MAYTDYTGVLRSYRGRGVALALNARSLEAVRAVGVKRVMTEMELGNVALRTVNERLGFEPGSGRVRLVKAMS